MDKRAKEFFMKTADAQIASFKRKEMSHIESDRKVATNFGDYSLTAPMPIMPEWGSQDRVQEPKTIKQKNRYWRLYFARDPIIATVIDLFAEMIASSFEISGDGVDGEIKDTYEYMLEKTELQSKLSFFVKEYLAIGEVFPQLVYDDDLGIWTDLVFHNPDNIELKEYPLWGMDPEITLKLSNEVKSIFTVDDPNVKNLVNSLPREVKEALYSKKGIKLNTDVNAAYIARKNHPYSGERGHSVIERLFRILTYEDAVVRSSLATALRHAAPLKIAKIGSSDMSWIPDKDYEQKILQLLSVAEIDPQAFLVLPWFVQFEAFGTTERAMSIKNEWEIIERCKLTALGISKGFMHGEAKYSNLQGNMETLFMRMKNIRNMFENGWILPKFFRPVAEMNKFIKRSKAELDHNVRTSSIKKMSKVERLAFNRKQAKIEETKYIIPTLHWSLPLETAIEQDKLNAFELIKSRLELPVSKSTTYAAAGMDWEEEFRQILDEEKIEKAILAEEGVSEEELKEIEDKTEDDSGGGMGSPISTPPSGDILEEPEEIPEGEEAPEEPVIEE